MIPSRLRGLEIPIGLGLAKLVFHLATANGYGYFRDEFYYLACGEHLDWGYVDHAPLVGWIARVVSVTLGTSRVALRFFPALCGGATVFLAGLFARRLGGGRFAQALAATCVFVAPYSLALAHLFTMNALDPVLWTAALLALLHAARPSREHARRGWIAFGVIAGIGLLNKHAMLFLGAAVAVAVVLTPQRSQLRTPWPWLALAIALAIFAPNLLWQARHDFPTWQFMQTARAHMIERVSPVDFLKEQILGEHPVAAPVWIAGLGWTLVAPRARAFRAVGIVFAFLLALFIVQNGKPYYLAPAYPAVFAAGGVALEAAIRRAWARAAAIGVVVVTGAATAPIAMPLLPVPVFQQYAPALGIKPSTGERDEHGALPQIFADMFGWEAMVDQTARAYASLSPEEQRVAAIYADNWGEAGAVDFFGPRLGLPKAISGHNSYWIWGPGEGRGEVLIVIGGDERDHREVYEDVRRVDETDHPLARPIEQHIGIFVCRKPRATLREIWPRVRRYG